MTLEEPTITSCSPFDDNQITPNTKSLTNSPKPVIQSKSIKRVNDPKPSRETSNQNTPTTNKDQDRLSWTNQESDNKPKDQLRKIHSRNIQGNKIFGSFQSIPEHCDVGINKQGSGSSGLADRSSKYDQRLQEPVPKVISRPAELLRVQFVKGAGRPSLGFTIAGGSDSPKGSMGIYVKTVLPGGQAEKQGCLRTGDEILSVNTVPLSGLTRTQATAVFAKVRTGTVTLRVLRRGTAPPTELPTASNRCSRCDFTNFTNHTNHGVGYDHANNTNALSRSSTYIISPGEGDYSDSDMTDLSIPDVGSNRGTYVIDSNKDNGFGFADNAYHAGIGQEDDDVDGDFDMCRDIEEVSKTGSGGYIKRAKRLYSAITTNF
ncbi:PDZ domain-containing protein 2-like [Ctenocephalides felis]|uniref:PDZ domain-containing protein 2-like n=1 Tax=Ctenocephalides felis TaxID=7515 RepID=UPI000E6E4882|nr:PDZ domain-containing protein 2-like [Ctenocephalides felis]